jgi:hypothetical protein
MSLVTCPSCSAQIWDTAISCPQCSFKFQSASRSFYGNTIRVFFFLFNIFMVSAVVIGLLEPDIRGEHLIYPLITWVSGGTILGLLHFMNPAINYANPSQQRTYMIKQRKIVTGFVGILIVIIYFGFLIGNI